MYITQDIIYISLFAHFDILEDITKAHFRRQNTLRLVWTGDISLREMCLTVGHHAIILICSRGIIRATQTVSKLCFWCILLKNDGMFNISEMDNLTRRREAQQETSFVLFATFDLIHIDVCPHSYCISIYLGNGVVPKRKLWRSSSLTSMRVIRAFYTNTV